MIYKVEEKILPDVRVALDMNMEDERLAGVGDEPTLMLNDIIRSKVEEAVRRVHMMAPNHLLDLGHNFGDAVRWDDHQSGWVELPCDFMRLVVFEMSDWERPVFAPITADDPAYARQKSRFKGMRGTAQSPVCAIATRPTGNVLEFYSCKGEDATVRRAVYLPYPKIEHGGIKISERCYEAVVYTAAALTLMTYGDTEKANGFFELAKGILG